MSEVYMVISKSKSGQSKERFNNYDKALDYALKKSESGLYVILLQMNFETMKWFKRLVIQPPESV